MDLSRKLLVMLTAFASASLAHCGVETPTATLQAEDSLEDGCVSNVESYEKQLDRRNKWSGGADEGAIWPWKTRLGDMSVSVSMHNNLQDESSSNWGITVAVILPGGEKVNEEEFTVEVTPIGCEHYKTLTLDRDSLEAESGFVDETGEYVTLEEVREDLEKGLEKEKNQAIIDSFGQWWGILDYEDMDELTDGRKMFHVKVARNSSNWPGPEQFVNATLVAPALLHEQKFYAEVEGTPTPASELTIPFTAKVSWKGNQQSNVVTELASWGAFHEHDTDDSGLSKHVYDQDSSSDSPEEIKLHRFKRTAWLAPKARRLDVGQRGFSLPDGGLELPPKEGKLDSYRFVSEVIRNYPTMYLSNEVNPDE